MAEDTEHIRLCYLDRIRILKERYPLISLPDNIDTFNLETLSKIYNIVIDIVQKKAFLCDDIETDYERYKDDEDLISVADFITKYGAIPGTDILSVPALRDELERLLPRIFPNKLIDYIMSYFDNTNQVSLQEITSQCTWEDAKSIFTACIGLAAILYKRSSDVKYLSYYNELNQYSNIFKTFEPQSKTI